MTGNDDIDQLAKVVADIPEGRLAAAVKRNDRIHIRLSPLEKQSIKETAQHCGMTVTDYLLRLHALVAERIVGTAAAPRPGAPGPAAAAPPLAVLPDGSKPRRAGPDTVARMPAKTQGMRKEWGKFLALIEAGHLMKDACEQMGIHRTTPTKWRSDPEYLDRLAEAKAKAKANKKR